MIKKCVFLNLFLLLTACSSNHNYDVDTTNLNQLENVHFQPGVHQSNDLGQLRNRALEDTALSLGAQGGLAWSSEKINDQLNKDKKYLDSIFNFNAMVLSHGVMPPVLEEGDNTLNLADPNTIRVSDRTYKIVKQARFATTPPNWREYLWLTYSRPDLPDKSLFPKTEEERCIWKKAIKAGWHKGVEQSYSIFQQNLALLKRDFRGMALYRKLLQQKMISPPFVSRAELGITGDGENMRINDQVLRIVELPKLQTSGKNWNAIVVKNDG